MKLLRTKSFLYLFPLLACTLPAGCTAPRRIKAVPEMQMDRATISGMPCVRTWSDRFSPEFSAELFKTRDWELADLKANGVEAEIPPAVFVAISGGGANGAFGAGLLCGWTDKGTRPVFKAVTGISTGALTAPFAFLGSEYDDELRQVYTQVRTNDILKQRGLISGFFSDALADNAPLWRLMERMVNEELLQKIAAEYRKGRILLVATTNLDAQRGVIWNMGAIAASGHPDALRLFHSILIASAAIPAAFPPVMIDVEVEGKKYQEMHVDGGALAQMFLYPASLSLSSEATNLSRQRKAYIIRNSRLDPAWAEVQRRTLPIAARAIGALIQSQGVGDIYRLFLITKRDKVDFNLTYIPATFNMKAKEEFDPEYMSELFEVGYQLAKEGEPWEKSPPGFWLPSEP